MLQNFRTYQLAIEFYRECEGLKLKFHLKDQLARASSSIVLNLAEGTAKPTKKDRIRFYFISLGSFRECESIVTLANIQNSKIHELVHQLGSHLYRLCHH